MPFHAPLLAATLDYPHPPLTLVAPSTVLQQRFRAALPILPNSKICEFFDLIVKLADEDRQLKKAQKSDKLPNADYPGMGPKRLSTGGISRSPKCSPLTNTRSLRSKSVPTVDGLSLEMLRKQLNAKKDGPSKSSSVSGIGGSSGEDNAGSGGGGSGIIGGSSSGSGSGGGAKAGDTDSRNKQFDSTSSRKRRLKRRGSVACAEKVPVRFAFFRNRTHIDAYSATAHLRTK
jgi:hypothetical protein